VNCNCIGEIEKNLAKKYSSELGVDATADCMASGFSMSGNLVRVIHKTDFRITAPAKGFVRGNIMPVFASYCPFCGTSTAAGEKQ
jgi:hypothetical protein